MFMESSEKQPINNMFTANFEDFKKKVESVFGSLENMAEKEPKMYAHQVLSHGFMEHLFCNQSTVLKEVEKKVENEIKDKVGIGMLIFDIKKTPRYHELYWKYLKEEYLIWAKNNKIPEHLIEMGWEEYKND